MNKMKKNIVLIALTFTAGQVIAQQEPQFTQYFDNMLFVNPAYAGSNNMLSIIGMHREQWVGFDGAPRTSTLSVHSPLRYESVGLGFTAVNDQIGPMNQTMFYADFSYTVELTKVQKLSFGLKGGFNMINLRTADLVTTEVGNPKLLQNSRFQFNPNVGAGVYYHTPHFFAGVSTPKILENSYGGNSTTNLERRHYYGIIGGVFTISKLWKLRPSSQIKVTSGAPLSVDLSVAGIYADKLWLGALYRHNAAVGGFVQYQISAQFRIGIASDFSTQAIRSYNSGTFEAMLSYDFNFRKDGIRSTRYF